MEVDVFVKVKVADVECTDQELYDFVKTQIFGGLINVKNPLEKEEIFKKIDLVVKKSNKIYKIL